MENFIHYNPGKSVSCGLQSIVSVMLLARFHVPTIWEHALEWLGLVLSIGIVFYVTTCITLHSDHFTRWQSAHCSPLPICC